MHLKIAFSEELYGRGGFYDDAYSLADLNDVCLENKWQIEMVSQVYPGANYKRSVAVVNTADENFRRVNGEIFSAVQENYSNSSPCIHFKIYDCLIYQSAIYVLDNGEAYPFYPTCRSNDRPYLDILDETNTVITATSILPNDGRANFFIGSVGSFNYGHWLVDDLPRIKAVLEAGASVNLIMYSYPGMNEVRMDAVHHLTAKMRADVRVIFVSPYEVLYCDEINYISPVSYHPYVKNPHAVKFVRDNFRPNRIEIGDSKKIFVRRRTARGRKLLNSSEVEAVFVRNGFKIVDPEGLSFQNQVDIFSHARVIAGVMGAAMCNTIFSSVNSQLLYLSPDDWVEPFYWDMAAILDHSYFSLHGTRKYNNVQPALDDFSIDVDRLQENLAQIDEKMSR